MHNNNEVYGKYLKIKNSTGTKKTSVPVNGVENVINYIKDNDKTKSKSAATNKKNNVNASDKLSGNISDVKRIIDYMQNDMKIINPETMQHLVSGHNCDPANAVQDFKDTEQFYHSNKTEKLKEGQVRNEAFHIILSYRGSTLDPEMVHKLGKEFTKRLCGDEFQAVICTHLNTNNYHNHIAVNAYALDGHHKFKDEKNVYKKFWKIADELSLEYGLPVMQINGESHSPSSRKEYDSMKNKSSWKEELRTEIIKAVSVSSSYEEILLKLEAAGYKIKINTSTVTFEKDGKKVRDKTLGSDYTREALLSRLKEKTTEQLHNDITKKIKIESDIKNKLLKPVYVRNIFISKYDEYGRKRSFLVRYLLLLKSIIEQTMDTYYSSIAEKMDNENIIFMRASSKQKLLDDDIKLCDEENITDENVLENKLKELYIEKEKTKKENEQLEFRLEKYNKLMPEYHKYVQEIYPRIKDRNINIASVLNIGKDDIDKSLAAIDPMQPKTRSALFKSIHNSPYRLFCKFKDISEEKGVQIIKAIKENRMLDLPYGLKYIDQKNYTEKDLPNPEQNISLEDEQLIKNNSEIIKKLIMQGIITNTGTDNLKILLEKQKQYKSEYELAYKKTKMLYGLKMRIRQYKKPVFSYGTLYNKKAEAFYKSVEDLKNSEKNTEMLSLFISRLNNIKNTESPVEIEKMDIPFPDEYRFLYDLKQFIPEAVPDNFYDPAVCHAAITILQQNKYLESIIEKEQTKNKDMNDFKNTTKNSR